MDRFRGKLKAKPAHFRSFLNDPASKDFIASLTKSKVSPAYRFMFASNDNCKNFVRYVACVDAYSIEIVAGKFLKRAAVLMWVAPFASLGVAVLSRYLRDGVFNLDSLMADIEKRELEKRDALFELDTPEQRVIRNRNEFRRSLSLPLFPIPKKK
ncbi:hypothetical protein Q7M15_05055 [Candidatus Liberibacter asiaticus]